MEELLKQEIFNNTIMDYLICLGTLIVSILLLFIIKKVVIKRLLTLASKTDNSLDDFLVQGIDKYLPPMLYFGSFYLCTRILTINDNLNRIIEVVTAAFVFIFGALFITKLLVYLITRSWERMGRTVDLMAVKWITIIIRIVVWIIALLLFLDNIGIEITTLVASLGVGGIAIAFAAQAVLEDLFSFFTIFLDQPFELNDYIVVGEMKGTVEHIGLKTTRVRSLDGETLIFSNKDLTNSRLRNYKGMEQRRIFFTIGVLYETPASQLRAIPKLIETIIEEFPGVVFERAHFCKFAESSLNFEISCYVMDQDFIGFMDIQQELLFRIKERLEAEGISFAYPTRTLHIQAQDQDNI